MPKADGDPHARDVAGAGPDRQGAPASPSNAESSNVKSAASATIEDDIPPVHVLEAAHRQDRKEAEDLLAGFDRPGRSPKTAPKKRDFVDYYARKKGDSGRESASDRAAASSAAQAARPKQIDVATVIKPRKREGMPAWLAWALAAAAMLAIGGVIAYLGTADPRSSTPTGSSAPTSISAMPFQNASNENIPPPDPAAPAATGTTTTPMTVIEPTPGNTPSAAVASTGSEARVPATSPRGVATRREPRGTPSGAAAAPPSARTSRGTNATDDTKPPPRDDFIRDL